MSTERGDALLARAVQALAEIEAASETPSHVEAAVMAQWDASRRRTKADRSRTSRYVRGAATTAAGVTLVAGLVWQQGGFESTPVRTTSPSPVVSGVPQDAGARYETVAVVGGPLQANEPIRIVRMRVARSVLSELGISSAARADTVDIDVLVGEDGVARGVRVPISEL